MTDEQFAQLIGLLLDAQAEDRIKSVTAETLNNGVPHQTGWIIYNQKKPDTMIITINLSTL